MTLRTDGIWVSDNRETAIVKDLSRYILDHGYVPTIQDDNNFGYPYGYQKDKQILHCRFIDSVFQPTPDAWTDPNATIVTDNYPLKKPAGKILSLLPELWHIWRFDPVYEDCTSKGFNCFMNRLRGDRNEIFYELIRRNLLYKGSVSYNVSREELNTEYNNAQLYKYDQEHHVAQNIVPYNQVDNRGSLEQVIMQTNVSLILETFMNIDHITFSEKLFRALQLPRPWILFCSPSSVQLLRDQGFDVLDDYVNHNYDREQRKHIRMQIILDELETFVTRVYNRRDYERFEIAATNNKQLLDKLSRQWRTKIKQIKRAIANA